MKKKTVEGYLYCSPYVGDYWFLSESPLEIEKHGDLELPKQSIDDITIPLDKFEKKKVRITIEELKK